MIKALAPVRWSILMSILTTLVIVQLVMPMYREAKLANEQLAQAVEDAKPVVVMTGTIVKKDSTGIWVHIRGTKAKTCEFMFLTAFASKDGVKTQAMFESANILPIDGSTKPVGDYDLGLWHIWPVNGADHAYAYVQHKCDGKIVVSEIANVKL